MLTREKKNNFMNCCEFVLKNQIKIGLCQQIMYRILYIKKAHSYIIHKKLLMHIILTCDHSPMVHLDLDVDN